MLLDPYGQIYWPGFFKGIGHITAGIVATIGGVALCGGTSGVGSVGGVMLIGGGLTEIIIGYGEFYASVYDAKFEVPPSAKVITVPSSVVGIATGGPAEMALGVTELAEQLTDELTETEPQPPPKPK